MYVSGTAQRTYFVYSDEGLVAEDDGSSVELRSYGYRPDSTWTTDPLFLKQGNEYYFYQNDHLGTPQKLTGMTGAVVWSAQYAAFGQAQVENATVVNNLRLPGQYFDAETGLHYNFQRYYDPEHGRYLSSDPIGLEGGFNFYLYAFNSPIRNFDEIGLKTVRNGILCRGQVRHDSYLEFMLSCPKCEKIKADRITVHYGQVAGCVADWKYDTSEERKEFLNEWQTDRSASELKSLQTVNCDGNLVTAQTWMRSRFAGVGIFRLTSSGKYVECYQRNTYITYECIKCEK